MAIMDGEEYSVEIFGVWCLTRRTDRHLLVTKRRSTRERFEGHFTCAVDAFVEGEGVGDVWGNLLGSEW
jgi:hypothetical protein